MRKEYIKTLLKFLGVTAALILLYRIRAVFFPFILAGFLAYLLHWPVDWMEKRGIKRGTGIIVSYLLLGLIIYLTANIFLPSFIEEINDLLKVLPGYLQKVQYFLERQQAGINKESLPLAVKKSIIAEIKSLEKSIAGLLNSVLTAIKWVSTRLFDFLLAPILAYYILKDVHDLKKRLISYLPVQFRDEAIIFFRVCDSVFGRFIKGHLLICFVVGIVTGLALFFLNIPYSFLLGLIAGLLELIPYFGPILASIPILTIALIKGKIYFLKTLIVILLIQQLEGNVLAPKILGESLGLHPLIVIFLLLSGFSLGGVIGMILAVPMAAVVRNLYIIFRRREILRS